MNIIFNGLNMILNQIYSITGDWGITIVVLTVFVRGVLLPMSLKQRINMYKQQLMAKKMEEIKEEHKNNPQRLEKEMQKYYAESAKSMMGCLVTILQLPVLFSLYNVFIKMPVNVGTVIVPWITSLKLPDNYFILPIIYMVVQMLPQIISTAGQIKSVKDLGLLKTNLIMAVVFSIMFLAKAPIAIGIYLITTGLFSALEELGYRLYLRSKRNLGSIGV